MVVMIDNYDSFTYNIVQYCRELGADLQVVRNDAMDAEAIGKMNPDKVIVSPGPASPDEAGVSIDAIRFFSRRDVPVLGICLGHQAIAQAFGGKVVRAGRMMHGKTSVIRQENPSMDVLKGLPETFVATRYHSLIVEQSTLPATIQPTAYSEDDHEIMALQVKGKPVYGLQYHPESIMSQFGHEMIENFLKL